MMDDREFEEHLRRFRPVAPRPLPAVAPRRRGGRRLIAAAALALVAAGAWLAMRGIRDGDGGTDPVAERRQPPAAVSLVRLHALAAADPRALEDALDREARRLLPDVESGAGALEALSAQ